MGKSLSSQIRSTVTKAWGRAQSGASGFRKNLRGDVHRQVAGMSAAFSAWFDRTFPIIRKLVVIVLLLSGLAAVHFFGFVNAMPQSIQRQVATSFAPKFSALFLYYGTLALLGARLGTYVAVAMMESWSRWLTSNEAGKSYAGMKRYLRSATTEFSILEWPIFVIAPILLAVIYSDAAETLIALLVIVCVFVLLAPLALPQAALGPVRFFKRLGRKPRSIKRLLKNINFLVTLAVALFAMSFHLGAARYTRLAEECPVSIKTDSYTGAGIILAQTDDATLLLQQDPTRSHSRFTLIRDKLIVTATSPHDSELLESAPKPVSSAASAAPLKAVECRS